MSLNWDLVLAVVLSSLNVSLQDVNIFAEVLSPQSIKITWNQFPLTDEEINGYTLSYKSLNSSVDNTTTATYFDARISFLIISELEEFVTYSFTLLPLSNREVITRSSTIQTTTWSDVPTGPPLNVTVTGADGALLLLTYDGPEIRLRNGDVTRYEIRYTRVDSGISQMIIVGSDTLESVIPGLVANTNYSVQVAAVNVNGTGPFSDVVYGVAGQDKPSAPHILSAGTIQPTSVTLSWLSPDTPNGIITQYEVQFSTNNTTSFVNFTGTLMGTVGGLLPGTMYILQIRAYTRVGAGPFSGTITLETLPEVLLYDNQQVKLAVLIVFVDDVEESNFDDDDNDGDDSTEILFVIGGLLVVAITGFVISVMTITILLIRKTRGGKQTGISRSPSCVTQLTTVPELQRTRSDTSYDEINTNPQLQDVDNITVNPSYGGALTLMNNPAYNSTDGFTSEQTDCITYEETDS